MHDHTYTYVRTTRIIGGSGPGLGMSFQPQKRQAKPKTDMKAVLTPRSNGHGILSLIDNLCAPLAFQYLLNDSHSDA